VEGVIGTQKQPPISNVDDETVVCKILYFIAGMILLAELGKWRSTKGQKMVTAQVSLQVPTQLTLIHETVYHSIIYSTSMCL
jgi:hypothetical protein